MTLASFGQCPSLSYLGFGRRSACHVHRLYRLCLLIFVIAEYYHHGKRLTFFDGSHGRARR
jgi:hypothetical protein